MAKIIKIGLRLFIITIVAALFMGITNLATKGPIKEQQIKAADEAKRTALPQAEEFSEVGIIAESAGNGLAEITEINAGNSGNNIVGYIFNVKSKGFGGDMEIIVGINIDDKIESIQIGEHGETPGLGAKMKEDSFMDQYSGKDVNAPITVNKSSAGDQEIQAITGATITSDAVTSGVNLASKYYEEVLKNGGGSSETE